MKQYYNKELFNNVLDTQEQKNEWDLLLNL